MVNTNFFFSLSILAISLSMVLHFSNATSTLTTNHNAINRFCNTAENKTLCNSIVNGTKTWKSATAYAISETLKIAKQGKPIFEDLVKKLQGVGLSKVSKASIGHTCSEIYDFAIECLQGASSDLRYGYLDRLATKLSAVTGPSSKCIDLVSKSGMDLQLSKYFAKLGLYSRICLSIARAA
ncbi:hypothetical protein OSB04_022780 [Centaurea solstitialis]|uniref:Pectinesterase inhibitor domain-containing protein n=1 Tax=Centaurea solstitialis TaxID=347529 RepID=A0AA38SIM7_9ASTR|nr:hypothetical protein OSB04_022780 [Centaurea solstitialis]